MNYSELMDQNYPQIKHKQMSYRNLPNARHVLTRTWFCTGMFSGHSETKKHLS